MNNWQIVLLLAFLAAVAIWIVWDFALDLLLFLDPEGEAKRRLAKRHASESAEYQNAVARLSGENRTRNLAALSAAGLIGMIGTFWVLLS